VVADEGFGSAGQKSVGVRRVRVSGVRDRSVGVWVNGRCVCMSGVFRVGCVGVIADKNAVGAGVVRLGEDAEHAEDDGAPGTTPDGQT
jgi:hypothetical protein